MKKSTLSLLTAASLFIVSCHKNNGAGNSPTSNDNYLSSVVTWSGQQILVDSFSYDGSHRLARYGQYVYSAGSTTPDQGWSATFALPGNDAPPTAYTYTTLDNPGAQDLHQLSYDGNGRIIKDTSLSGTGFVAYYTYPSNAIATTVYFDFDVRDHQVDTLFMSNGNISKEKVYYPNAAYTADSLEGSTQYSFSGVTNPAWHPAVANSIGPLLFILNIDDYGSPLDPLSKNAFSKVGIVDTGLPVGYGYTFNQQTDSKGRLVQLTPVGGAAGDKVVYNYY